MHPSSLLLTCPRPVYNPSFCTVPGCSVNHSALLVVYNSTPGFNLCNAPASSSVPTFSTLALGSSSISRHSVDPQSPQNVFTTFFPDPPTQV